MDEQTRKDLVKSCIDTLTENCSSFVAMIQVAPDFYGELAFGGNIESCTSMVQRIQSEFELSQSDEEEDEESDEDNEE